MITSTNAESSSRKRCGVLELLPHAPVDHVVLVRPVEGEGDDVVVLLAQQRVGVQGESLLRAGIEKHITEPNDATPFLPERRTLKDMRTAVQGCRGCHLWRGTTQAVFGEGLKRSSVMFVGEQPGDREDRAGRPFVGPAGRELDRALEVAGIARDDVYITNVVKHFKFEERGKRRIHQTPKRFEIEACLPWLEEELKAVAPEALVLLGATAAKALLGSSFRLTRHRGELLESELARVVTATIHPSAILRAPDDASRHAERSAFAEDLGVVARALA